MSTWRYEPLLAIAPPKPSKLRFRADDSVWHLTLDQIESHTGRIVDRRLGPASECGGSTYVFDQGNVLYSKLRPYLNKVVLPSEPGIATTELVPLRPLPKVILPSYLAHYLRSSEFVAFASGCVAGVKMPRVIMDKLWKQPVPLPPLSEQRRIVEILDQADALRKLRAEADAKAERILPALFLKMLGDPANWSAHPKAVPLGKVVKLVSGATPTKTVGRFWQGDIPWVSPKDMKRDFISDAEDHVSLAALEESNLKLVEPQSVLIVVRGMILAHSVPVAVALRRLTINQDMKALVPTHPRVTGFFLWAALKVAKAELLARVKTAAHGTRKLDTPELLAFPIVEPTEHQRLAVERSVAWFRSGTTQRESRRAKLEFLFTLLLRHAFSGDLTASWRAAHMKELLQEMELQARALAKGAPAEATA